MGNATNPILELCSEYSVADIPTTSGNGDNVDIQMASHAPLPAVLHLLKSPTLVRACTKDSATDIRESRSMGVLHPLDVVVFIHQQISLDHPLMEAMVSGQVLTMMTRYPVKAVIKGTSVDTATPEGSLVGVVDPTLGHRLMGQVVGGSAVGEASSVCDPAVALPLDATLLECMTAMEKTHSDTLWVVDDKGAPLQQVTAADILSVIVKWTSKPIH